MIGPFIYNCDRSIEVYQKTTDRLQGDELADRITNLAWAYHSIGDLIPHTMESFWSGHFFPWAESWNELQISTTLCFFGMYKQSMVALRTGLELGLLSVYWNLFDDGHQVIQQWLSSREETPRFHEIWERLEVHPNFELFQAHADIRSRLLELGFLHDYVHSRGARFSNTMGILKSNFQTFEEELLLHWLEAFEEVVIVLCTLHLVKYPLGTVRFDYSRKFGIDIPMFGGLGLAEVDRLESLLGRPTFSVLEELAGQDGHVQEILSYVDNLPDMTENEVEAQIVDFDKRQIENMGLERWLQIENELIQRAKNQEEIANWRRRIEALSEWARERGFERPAWERNSGGG
jgi:hypothetical protein